MDLDEQALRDYLVSPVAKEAVKMLVQTSSKNGESIHIRMKDGTMLDLAGPLELMRALKVRFGWKL
jgi:hypothetical protein